MLQDVLPDQDGGVYIQKNVGRWGARGKKDVRDPEVVAGILYLLMFPLTLRVDAPPQSQNIFSFY